MQSRASFTGLPTELLLAVIEHFGTRDVAALSGVTKRYNSICRSIIFQNVDLSIHNRGEVLCTHPTEHKYMFCRWNESSDSLRCNNIPPNMQKKQEAFLSAVIGDPSVAQNVRSFSWTLLLLDSNGRTNHGYELFAINKNVILDPKSPFNKLWDVFASLTNVRTLDLAWLSRDLATPLIHRIPLTLFPAATTVRLAGIMPYALAASILLANPQNLLHLDFNNLQQSGIIPLTQINDDFDMHDNDPEVTEDVGNAKTKEVKHMKKKRRFNTRPARTTSISKPIPPHRQTRQSWTNITPFGSTTKYFNSPGPMQNLLGALAGKCTSLQTLLLRKAGARDQFDFPPLCTSKETDVYAEWALFLTSVRPTLQSLVFEQGERLTPRADWVQPVVRPMDQIFGDVIFPALARAGVGQWPKMKKVEVRGVQQWREDDGLGSGERVLVDGRDELRGAFGKGVEVVVYRNARLADHLGVGYN